MNTPLTVRQDGQPELEVPAHWATRPFTSPFYWNVRAGRSGPRGGWEVTYAHAEVSIESGKASTSNVAFHGLFGLGVAFP